MKYEHGWAFPDTDEFMVGQMKDDGTYQASHLRMALQYVTDFRVAIDGGAHVGTWSRLLAPRFDRVIAAEPSPDTFEALRANMTTFGCDNVECRQVALGLVPGLISMGLDGRALAMKNTGGRFVVPGGLTPCQTLDSWELPSLGFLKLDVEGSEPDVLAGAIETLKRCRPVVLFEDKGLWSRYGHGRMLPHQLLQKAGFRHLARASMDEIWGPV